MRKVCNVNLLAQHATISDGDLIHGREIDIAADIYIIADEYLRRVVLALMLFYCAQIASAHDDSMVPQLYSGSSMEYARPQYVRRSPIRDAAWSK